MSIEFSYDPSPDISGSARFQDFFFDPAEAARRLRLLERSGFTRIVIDDSRGLLANMDLAAQALGSTHGIGVALTHWAGFIEPVAAARSIAAIDDGRLSLRIPHGQAPGERDGLSHQIRQKRTDEYLVLLKRLWLNTEPFDHEGPHYRVFAGKVEEKGPQGAAIPIRMGGLSGTAIRIAARHASTFELAAGSRQEIMRQIERANAASAEFGKKGKLRFALAFDVDLRSDRSAAAPPVRGSANAIALRGDPAQVATSLLAYAELGVSDFVIRGLLADGAVERFAAEIMPLLANSVARGGHGAGRTPLRGQEFLGR